MPITEKKCQCGCGRTFLGTERRKWATDYCRLKMHRKRKRVSCPGPLVGEIKQIIENWEKEQGK